MASCIVNIINSSCFNSFGACIIIANYFKNNFAPLKMTVNSNCGFKRPFHCNFEISSGILNSFNFNAFSNVALIISKAKH